MERPFPAYEGTEPFIFVCYAHDDAALVYPELTRLRDAGFHIWYDEGISPGSEWSESLAQQIQQCAVFLFFVTPQSVEREHCRREVNFALEERCTILPVHLEPTNVPAALKLSLSHRQAILRHEHAQKAYERKLDRALEAAALGRGEMLETSGVLQVGDWQLDVGNHCLIRDEERRTLEPKDLSVLLHLAEAAPDLVSTEDLLERSWPGMVVGDNALHQVIGRLRRAFGDDARNPSYIETLSRRGYRLLSNLHEVGKSNEAETAVAAERAPEEVLDKAPAKRPQAIRLRSLAVAVLLVAAVVLITQYEPAAIEDEPITIAVLPLASLDNEPEHQEFTVGVTRSLWSGFRRLDGVELIAQTSSNRYAEGSRDARMIARQLNTDYLVEGTVLRTRERLRITFSLIDGSDGTSTLTQEYDRVIADSASLFELYDDIAMAAGDVLERFVAGMEIPTNNLTALNLLYRAYAVTGRENLEKHINLIEQALALDPRSTHLRAHLAYDLVDAAQRRPDPRPLLRRAREEAYEALDREPASHMAAMALAKIDIIENKPASQSLIALQKAHEAGAHSSETAVWKSVVLLNAGRYEAAEAVMQRAHELDRESAEVSEFLARTLFMQGKTAQAWEAFDYALALDPRHSNAMSFALRTALIAGDPARFRAVMSQIAPDAIPDWAQALFHAYEGDVLPLQQKIRDYEALRAEGVYLPAYLFKMCNWWTKDYEAHFRWYAIAEREQNVLFYTNADIAIKPDYWKTLEAWAVAEPEHQVHRQQQLSEHRERIARITKHMALSDEEVLRALTPSEVQAVWRNPFSYLQEAFDFTGRSIQGGGS